MYDGTYGWIRRDTSTLSFIFFRIFATETSIEKYISINEMYWRDGGEHCIGPCSLNSQQSPSFNSNVLLFQTL